MLRRKLLALLLAAAMAVSLLAGCGKNQSVARALLKLLDGQYANVSVEMDPQLEADLRQVLGENETDDEAAIRAALETALGSTITFRYLGEGQQGDTAFDLVFCAGSDSDAAVQAAYSQWNSVFSTLPDDGQYGAGLALVQTENGFFALVKATVDRAGTPDKPDSKPDPEPEPDTNTITGNGFSYDVKGNKVTVNGTEGLQKLFTGGSESLSDPTSAQALAKARETKFAGITITLKAGNPYTVDTTEPLIDTFSGKLTSDGDKAKIELSGGASLFGTITSSGEVSNLNITVTEGISVSKIDGSNADAGAVAGLNDGGKISDCMVTINGGKSIEADSSSGSGSANAGGLVGRNENSGEISGCEVIVNGTISAERTDGNGAYAGGIVGCIDNVTSITDCSVTLESGTIQATGSDGAGAYTGGIAGCIDNVTCITSCSVTLEGGTIQATTTTSTESLGSSYAGGMVGIITVYEPGIPLTYGPATGSGSITAQAGSDYVTVTADSTSDFASWGKAYAGTTCGMATE